MQIQETAHTAGKVVDGTIPERLVIRGVRLVKARARRRDLVGSAAYRALELVHGGLGATVASLGRIREVSTPPARPTTRRAAPARRARRTTRSK